MTSPERFFFLHLQKTAGTALAKRLHHQFPDDAIYPDASDGSPPDSVLVVEHLAARVRARGDAIRVITGHFPLCTTEVLGGGFTTFTVLRDPVERTLSYLRHQRVLGDAPADVPLEQIYDDDFRFHSLIHNHMVKMLSMTPAEATADALTRVEFTPERLTRAKAALDTVDAVGVQDDFEAFCRSLERRWGWDLGPPVRMNRTAEVPVAESFRRRIAADNADDAELFEHARGLWSAARREG